MICYLPGARMGEDHEAQDTCFNWKKIFNLEISNFSVKSLPNVELWHMPNSWKKQGNKTAPKV